MNRRFFLQGITAASLGLTTRGKRGEPRPGVNHFAAKFEDVAPQAGLTSPTVFGGRTTWKYILETTGCGAAFYDYDNDGWQDIFLVNGSRLEGFPKGQEPISRLFKNNRDGTFTDVTLAADVAHSGWGQGCCVGDNDNDGFADLS